MSQKKVPVSVEDVTKTVADVIRHAERYHLKWSWQIFYRRRQRCGAGVGTRPKEFPLNILVKPFVMAE